MRRFRDLGGKHIRRDSFERAVRLIEVIEADIAQLDQDPHIFVWTASAEGTLAIVAKVT